MSVNKVTLLGFLGRDPELRTLQPSLKLATLSLATSERWKDKQSGEQKEKTEWHNVVLWGALAEVAEKYLKKGTRIYIEGKLETRKWQDQGGQDRYTTEIHVRQGGVLEMLGERNQKSLANKTTQAPASGRYADDDIPF